MTKKEAVALLRRLDGDDQEYDHVTADRILLALIDDPQVTEAFEKLDKWYA